MTTRTVERHYVTIDEGNPEAKLLNKPLKIWQTMMYEILDNPKNNDIELMLVQLMKVRDLAATISDEHVRMVDYIHASHIVAVSAALGFDPTTK